MSGPHDDQISDCKIGYSKTIDTPTMAPSPFSAITTSFEMYFFARIYENQPPMHFFDISVDNFKKNVFGVRVAPIFELYSYIYRYLTGSDSKVKDSK